MSDFFAACLWKICCMPMKKMRDMRLSQVFVRRIVECRTEKFLLPTEEIFLRLMFFSIARPETYVLSLGTVVARLGTAVPSLAT